MNSSKAPFAPRVWSWLITSSATTPPDELLLDEALELADDEELAADDEELALLEDDDELLLDALLDEDALLEEDELLDEDELDEEEEEALVEDDELDVPVTHVLATHCCMLAQSLFAAHATQFPAPSHTLPPFDMQGVLGGFDGKIGIPELHAPVRQSFVDVGTLVLSVWGTMPP
jgi:hypothetical protein